jgi:LacI family transcriptional regulator
VTQQRDEPVGGAPHPVTMRDVAAAAGVSVATVSLVMNKKKNARIGADARQRVHDAIESLGYRPNALAQNLVNGDSRFIGLVADAIATTPFAGQIIHGAQDEAWRRGYVLLVANTEGDASAEREAIAMMLEHQVRGILYSTWYHREVEVPEALRETSYVLVNCFAPGAPSAVPDEVAGAERAIRHLLDAGHRRIAFINTTSISPARTQRLEGYRRALAEAGVAYNDELIFDAESDQEGGYGAFADVMSSGSTAVFCHNDRVAMGLYDAAHQTGTRVPEDLSVVGFDNQEVIAAHVHPPLTTVQLPHYELGALGVRALLDAAEFADGLPAVECPLVERQSVAVLSG